jgi:hypothetical protein
MSQEAIYFSRFAELFLAASDKCGAVHLLFCCAFIESCVLTCTVSVAL